MRNSANLSTWKKAISRSGASILVMLSIFAAGSLVSAAQDAVRSNAEQTQPTERKDDWRLVPQDILPEPTDPREKELFDIRAREADQTNMYGGPLDEPQPDGSNHGESFSNGAEPEIPIRAGEPIVVATFESFKTYLTPSHQSIFTIVKLRVDQVLEPGEQGLSAGQDIDLMMSGGTVRSSDGRVITYRVRYEDAPYSIQPDRRYLFLLSCDEHSNTCGYRKTWDLTTGIAVPNSLDDVIRVRQGKSVTAGLTEDQLLDAVRQAIQQRKQQANQPESYYGHIRGAVTVESGHLPSHMVVALRHHDVNSATGLGDAEFAEIAPDGHYDFASVSPGDYVVSVNPFGPSPERPYPRVYFPDAVSDANAATIHLIAFGNVDNVNLTLPSAWRSVVVHVRVLLPDGSPALDAHINAYDVDYSWSGEPSNTDAGTDGRADLSVYEGRTYYLTALVSDGTQQRCAGPLKFTAEEGLVADAITIEHDGGNCLGKLRLNSPAPN